ncbi:hypothetical protein [Amycolatopsis sp. NPDC051071]|uniref:hypothetical protein n=1 Tax=Amycolatopsis sp. NPDC051071 TaxID=3154637 RepID=UPI00343B53DC
MGEPGDGRGTQAEAEIARQVKTANADTNLRANLKEPPPPPNVFDQLGMSFGATPAGGAGYRIDPEALAAQIRTFEDLRSRSRDQYYKLINAAQGVTPPSPDAPAVSQAQATRVSLIKAADHNRAISMYAQGLLDALRKANGTYRQVDEDTGSLFEKWSAR